MWAAGEQERYEAFFVDRAKRFEHRAMLLSSLAAPPEPYLTLFDQYEALLRPNLAEDEFEDTIPPTNQNVW